MSQPRKIAAISIARRVAEEIQGNFNFKCELGGLVGYQVGLSKKMTTEKHETRLLFCTTGVILEKLIMAKSLDSYTHIILDEIHEREADMDLLLILIRELMLVNPRNTRIILMSATMDEEKFSRYFTHNQLEPAIVQLTTPRLFQKKKFFLNEIPELVFEDSNENLTPRISLQLFILAKNIIVKRVLSGKKSILIFLPGIYEIKALNNLLADTPELENNCLIHLLHSSLSKAEQKATFMNSSKPKVVLSTNIAESSITITGPEVDCVIDFCLTKHLVRFDDESMPSLRLDWASKTSLEQRAGRTGRTCDGEVYRLVTRDFYEKHLPSTSIPEILRCPLETVVLRVKKLDVEPPLEFLEKALDPPPPKSVLHSILLLKEIGGLERLNNHDKFQPNDGKLTYVGQIMSKLPLDVRLSKLIIVGSLFSMLDEAIIIATGLNVQNIFRNSHRLNLDDYNQKLAWANGSGCDFIAILNAYKFWKHKSEQGILKDWKEEKRWCNRFNLERKKLHEMRDLIEEINHRLKKLNMESLSGEKSISWEPEQKALILKICIAGSFIPNFYTVGKCDEIDELDVCKAVADRNPYKTVIYKNNDNDFCGEIYEEQFKEKLVEMGVCRNANDITVQFDLRSKKVFVEFNGSESDIDKDQYGDNLIDVNSPQSLGKVAPEVYRALKLGKSGYKFTLNVMNKSDSEIWSLEHGFEPFKPIHTTQGFKLSKYVHKYPSNVVIPSNYAVPLEGNISHIDHCGKFFIQPVSQHNVNVFESIQQSMFSKEQEPFNRIEEVLKGQLVIAQIGNTINRARVVDVFVSSQSAICLLFDIGNQTEVHVDQLFNVGEWNIDCFDEPARCFEATLCELEPSFIKCPKGKWTISAIEQFRNIVRGQQLKIEVFSVVHSIASVRLFTQTGDSVNQMLIDLKYAQECEEGLSSKCEHELHKDDQSDADFLEEASLVYRMKINENIAPYIPSPPISQCQNKITLSGPESPLETKARFENSDVKVAPHSINSVLLRDDAHNLEGKLLVSAFATKSGRETVIHETTIMPNIPGFAAILAMIFAPEVALKRSRDKTRFVYVKYGLGYDENRKSFSPDRDFYLPVNVELLPEDFQKINNLRLSMSALLMLQPNESISSINDSVKFDLLKLIKKSIVEVITEDRMVFPCEYTDQKRGSWAFAIKTRPKEVLENGGGHYHMISRPQLEKFSFEDCNEVLEVLKQAEQKL